MIDWITENTETLKELGTAFIAIAGAIVMGARIFVKLTPTKKDDKFLAKLVNFMKHVGLYIE